MNIDFDKILAAGTQIADSAKKTATELAQKGKKQVDLVNAQTRLTKAQRQLGALVYSLVKNGEQNDLLVKKYVDAISRIEAEIEELKRQQDTNTAKSNTTATTVTYTYTAEDMEQTKNTCPNCGAKVEEDALFCNNCGAQL